MNDPIYEVKHQILDHVTKSMHERGGLENMDIQEMGMYVDMIKDLAEADEKCQEAEYYRAVTEAMDSSYGYHDERSRSTQSRMMPESYGRRRYSRGYEMSDYQTHLDALRTEMRNATPQEREHLIQQIRDMGVM